jgi:hypothetical protein
MGRDAPEVGTRVLARLHHASSTNGATRNILAVDGSTGSVRESKACPR